MTFNEFGMHPDNEDEEALPTVSKWPFYLGDVSLVGLAIAIAALNNWQPGGVQVFACVLAVALGAVVLTFPFVMEYLMFAREENEDRMAEIRLCKKQLGMLESALLKQHERLKKFESRSDVDDQRYDLLASAIDQKTKVDPPDLSMLTKRIKAIEATIADQVKMSDAEKPKKSAAKQEIASEIEQLPDDFSVSLGADLMMDDDDLPGAKEIAKAKKPVAKKAKKRAATKKEKSSQDTRESVAATVEVTKLMGIGNKPFLRGSGAGLNWEEGVEMDFQEIGKWTWSIAAPIDEAVELQVYRNDEDPDRKGKYTLRPGQSLEIVPEF